MKKYMNFKMKELEKVVKELLAMQKEVGTRYGAEITRLIHTIASKKANDSLNLKVDNLEKLSMELHGLEFRYGINLGQTIYHFMHSFHRN
jgi:hypothetical protein